MDATREQVPLHKMPTGTKEWADSNVNFLFGCRNNCRYCYARMMAVRFHRRARDEWQEMEVNVRIVSKRFARRQGRVMFPSSHDLFPEHLDIIEKVLGRLLDAGNQVLLTTKPRVEVIEAICDHFADAKDSIQFRFTIGSVDDELLSFWEPGAPTFEERLAALELAFTRGFKTSVSIEPFLDYDPIPLIDAVDPFVTESIWLGLMNYIPREHILETDEKWYAAIRQNYQFDHVVALYAELGTRDKIQFKDSIKKMLGLMPVQKISCSIH